MTTPADYFFYRVLQWRETSEPTDRMPLLTTKLVVSLTYYCNTLAILYCLRRFLRPLPLAAPVFSLVLGGIIISAVHFTWVSSGRYRTLGKKFAAESASQRTKRTRILYGYVVLSILTPLVAAFVLGRLGV